MCKRYSGPSYKHSRRFGLHAFTEKLPNVNVFVKRIFPRSESRTSYLSFVFHETLHHKDTHPFFLDMCRNCYNFTIHTIDKEAVDVCYTCGTIHGYASTNLNASYLQSYGMAQSMGAKETLPRTHSLHIYKRLTHFRYWLRRLQGKEVHKLSEKEWKAIHTFIHTHNVTQLDYKSTRFMLKRLGMQRYYNNTLSVMKTLTGKALVEFSKEQEELLCQLFVKVQLLFAKHHGIRVNMFAYPYVIRKLCELLGWKHVASVLPGLQSRVKLKELDTVWKDICVEAGIPFKSSLYK